MGATSGWGRHRPSWSDNKKRRSLRSAALPYGDAVCVPYKPIIAWDAPMMVKTRPPANAPAMA